MTKKLIFAYLYPIKFFLLISQLRRLWERLRALLSFCNVRNWSVDRLMIMFDLIHLNVVKFF